MDSSRFKFRAWDGERMVSLEVCLNKNWIGIDGVNIRIYYKPLILMQYTGLKDKNGTEIYEGDILELRDTVYTVQWSEEFFKVKIVGIPEGFKHKQAMSLSSQVSQSEVTGNIHEYPELL